MPAVAVARRGRRGGRGRVRRWKQRVPGGGLGRLRRGCRWRLESGAWVENWVAVGRTRFAAVWLEEKKRIATREREW